MSYAVRRSWAGVALSVGLVVTGCAGPSSSSVSAADTAPSTTTRALPSPTGAGCAATGDLAEVAELNLIEATKKIASTQTFATYLAEDPGSQKQYGSLDGVTAFVPVDSAWAKLDASALQKLAEPGWRRALVEYAVVPVELPPEAFTGEQTSAMQTFRAPGEVLSGHTSGEAIVLNGQANVVCSAIPFDGGLIYLLDTVLLPAA